MLTKKALVDPFGKVLDVRPVGFEYPSPYMWVACPPEVTTDWEYKNGELVAPTPQGPVPGPSTPPAGPSLSEKVDALLAATLVLAGETAEIKKPDGSKVAVNSPAALRTVLREFAPAKP